MPATLRPLSFGEILDQAFSLFRRLFVPLVLVQIICTGVIIPLQLFVAAGGQQFSALYLVTILINMIASALASAAVALLISENYLGRSLSAGGALRLAVPKIGPVILLSMALGVVLIVSAIPAGIAFASGMAILVPLGTGAAGPAALDQLPMVAGLMLTGFALLLLPLAVFAGLAVSTPALVIEDIGAGTALQRSWSLTRRFRLRAIGLLLLTAILIGIPFMGVTFLVTMFASEAAMLLAQALSILVLLILTPLIYCVLTLLYYDLRVRKEGFDLQVLADSLAA
ncbi:MAG TPA: hypothetical protein VFM12_05050 [Gemmatimonadales bacterium]|jgi:hypothetical protein|nr:hypothetical protein [Gemmatimonadales bacterium]